MIDQTDDLRRHARTTVDPPPGWPKDVRPISLEGLGLLGLDEQRQLYWDGKPIEIRRRLKFSRLQIVGALVLGIATLIGGIGTGVNEGFDFGCKVHWWTQGCKP